MKIFLIIYLASIVYNLLVMMPILLRVKFTDVNDESDVSFTIGTAIILAPLMTAIGFGIVIYMSTATNYGMYGTYVSMVKSIGADE